MRGEEKVAYVNAMTACALAEIAAMQAANAHMAIIGEGPVYDAQHFRDVPDRFGIHHNAVLSLFHEG